jgi:hypothetical protein
MKESDHPLSLRYPPYVTTEAQRERFDLSKAIAQRQVELYDDDPNPLYVWLTTRWLYHSDIPTGGPDEAVPQ